MRKYVQNERGNIMLLNVCLMSVLVVMFLMLMSFVKAFYIKDQASSAAEQASLAATAYFYEKVDEAINEIDQKLFELGSVTVENGEKTPTEAEEVSAPTEASSAEVDITVGKKSLADQIVAETNKILQSSSRFTHNEARIEAIDKVLSDELRGDSPRQTIVENELIKALNNDAINGLVQIISDLIEENGGTAVGSEIHYLNEENRIEIQTSSTYKPTIFANLFPKEGMEVKQTGEGPKVGFIKHLDGFQSKPYIIE
ncbi:TadE/TadG family type IV pilus assembly protein [Priestia abyssalis]|uniref:TadE/TadG family type IV pilus assembly protein n=1 Tax=Priestia abyssalis TaxID=1221450 RepID=UPI000994C7E4|nr:Tad domain-containing protein [Priestia abyssalis]